tara:strand:+ start:86 stop:673 length:588 start_codon:yes stop_codon:yes gene_type:complete
MNKKVLIQLFLFLIILVTCLFFYRIFFENSDIELSNTKENQQNDKVLLDGGNNQINEIIYKSNYSENNKYTVSAEFGELQQDNPDLMLLTNVKAVIILNDSDTIEISSNKANYNSLSYDTNFYQNVLVTFDNHQIYSDNFDLFFDKKISTIYNNVIYKNFNTTLRADKIDIDLLTKDSKIYMLNKSKKVKIKNLK